MRGEITLVAAGEDLDHATDGVRAVQAGLRATHDLHALDLCQRQVLVHRQAEVGAVDAHAIDQHHGVAGVGAAQEQRALLAQAAGIGQADAGAAAQQFLQRGGLAGFDLRAVDHLGRRDAVLQGDRVRVAVTRIWSSAVVSLAAWASAGRATSTARDNIRDCSFMGTPGATHARVAKGRAARQARADAAAHATVIQRHAHRIAT